MNLSEESLKSLRDNMIEGQLMGRGIKQSSIIDAFKKVPRHKFVDITMYKHAYDDSPLSIGYGQTISQPYIVALMIKMLEIKKKDKVLEIGTGSGYGAAILAELADTVFSVERLDVLASNAKNILNNLGYNNIVIKTGDGTLGLNDFAPFSKIIVTASFESIPDTLIEQLSEHGKLIMPVGPKSMQRLIVIEKNMTNKLSKKDVCGCAFVPLIGKYGWGESNPAMQG